MISRAQRFGAGILTLLIVALALRLVWVMATTETGVDIVWMQWLDAIGAPLGRSLTPLSKQPAAVQADYWLSATRDLPRAQTSATECMGAAWVLDGPSQGYLANMLEESPWARYGISGVPPFDINEDAAARAEQDFESACATKCLRLAAEAVRREPDNVEWRRMQALLQFASPIYWSDGRVSRSSDWLEVLDAGAAVDPENALYDYLAALEYWRASAEYDYDATLEGYVIKIHDTKSFEAGVRRFERGQEKPRLQFGERGQRAVAEFLAVTRLTHTDQADVAISRLFTFRVTGFAQHLARWQTARNADAERAGDVTAAAAQSWLRLKLSDQIQAGDEVCSFPGQQLYMRAAAAKRLLELGAKHPNLLTDADRDELHKAQVEAEARLELLKAAFAHWPGGTRPTPITATETGLLAVIAPRSALVCAFVAFVGWLLLQLRKSRQMSIGLPFGLWPHAAAWLIAYGLTCAVAQFPPDRSDWQSDVIRSTLSLAADSWQWRAIRWTSYYGYYAAVAMVMFTILLLSLLMHVWRGDWPRFKGELTFSVIRRCVVSLTVVAALWLAVSLAVTPTLIHIAEQDFHSKIDYFRDMPALLEKVKLAIDQAAAEQQQPSP